MIRVVDSLVGSGKTTAAIAMMNCHPEQRYLYVTPYLTEAGRIIAACPSLDFQEPSDVFTKTAALRQLLAEGKNIAITHELFSRQDLTGRVVQDISNYGYTLILDET